MAWTEATALVTSDALEARLNGITILPITQEDYDLLTPDASTLYIIVDEVS